MLRRRSRLCHSCWPQFQPPGRWDNRAVAAAVLASWPRRARPGAAAACGVRGCRGARCRRRPQVARGTVRPPTRDVDYGVRRSTWPPALRSLQRRAAAIRDATTATAGWLVLAAGSSGSPRTGRAGAAARPSFGASAPAPCHSWSSRRRCWSRARSASRPLRLGVGAGAAVVLAAAVACTRPRPAARSVLLARLRFPSLVVHAGQASRGRSTRSGSGRRWPSVCLALVPGWAESAAAAGRARRMLAPVFVPAGAGVRRHGGVCGAALLRRPLETAGSGGVLGALLRTCGHVRGAWAGLLLVVVRRLRQRAAVSRLAEELGAVRMPSRAPSATRPWRWRTGFRPPGGTSTARAVRRSADADGRRAP